VCATQYANSILLLLLEIIVVVVVVVVVVVSKGVCGGYDAASLVTCSCENLMSKVDIDSASADM
jgi:hypothetical protein